MVNTLKRSSQCEEERRKCLLKMEEGIKVIAAKPLMGMMMLVTFSTGEKRLFDATLLKGAAFEP